MKNLFIVFIVCVLAIVISPYVFCTDKYAQAAIDWNSGTWYDAASGGNPTTKPVAGDNAFTNGFVVTVSTNETCDNLTVTNVANAITVNSGITLTVRGLLDCATASPTLDAFGGSGSIKFTGAALSSPYLVTGNNLSASVIFCNLTFDPGNSITLTTGTGNIKVDAGTIEVVSGTVSFGAEIRGITTAVLQVDAGAVLSTSSQIRGSSSASSFFPTVIINGTLTTSNYLNATTLTVGSNGTLNTSYVGTQGWWNTTNAPTTMTLSGTVNYNGSGAQYIAGATYNNLTLSGSNTKTLFNNITVNGTMKFAGTASLSLNSKTLTYGGSSTLEYAGSATQTTTTAELPSSGGPHNLIITNSNGVILGGNATIDGICTVNGVLNCGTNTIGGSGSTTVNSSATVNIGHADGLAGNIFTLGSNSFSAGATYIYNGSVAQAISTYLADNLTGTLKINNSNGVSLNRDLTITSGTLDLTSGTLKTRFGVSNIKNLTIGSSAILSNYSSNSFIDGPLIATLASGVGRTFPIGSGTTYRPIILNMSVGQDVSAEMFNSAPSGSFAGSGVNKISSVRYYSISNGTSSNCTVTLPWGSDDGVSDLTKITTVYGANTSIWLSNDRSGSTTGDASSGAVTGAFTSITGADFTLGNITGGTNPLPVEMKSFSAVVQKMSAELKWSTATEVNNYGFNIERRAISDQLSAMSNWQMVGFVAGAGTSNSPHNYSFSDNNVAAGSFAYRLKQIDNNGSFKCSQETQVTIDVPKIFSLNQNYPNPFNPTTTIDFTVPTDGKATLKVFDLLGRQIATLFDRVTNGGETQRVVFDASRFTSGVYFARLEFGGMQSLRRMILMK